MCMLLIVSCQRIPRSKEPIRDEGAEGAHTQLGKENGRKGKYTKAREFDKDGNRLRDIEFTDHDRPEDHPHNPHQHKYKENETGVTRKKDKIYKPGTGMEVL